MKRRKVQPQNQFYQVGPEITMSAEELFPNLPKALLNLPPMPKGTMKVVKVDKEKGEITLEWHGEGKP